MGDCRRADNTANNYNLRVFWPASLSRWDFPSLKGVGLGKVGVGKSFLFRLPCAFPYIMQHFLLLLSRLLGSHRIYVCLVLVFGLLCFQLGFPPFYLFIYFGVIKFHALVAFFLVPSAGSQRLCFKGPHRTSAFNCTGACLFVGHLNAQW